MCAKDGTKDNTGEENMDAVNLDRPVFKIDSVVLDCKDAKVLADFYSRLLGWRKFSNGTEWEGITGPEGDFRIYFQTEPDYEPPVWPASPGCQQMMVHLDFAVSDLDSAVAYAISCGAKLADVQYSQNARVLLDPAGHPFCLCKH
jgi:catechol 2,3-dioxygenase-like lactoylglutathione lyase family enzyme